MNIAKTAILHPDVTLGENCIVEDFCIIGVPVPGQPNLPTVIGKNAHIRSHTVIYAGNKIGDHFSTGNKANIRELNHIGHHVSIGTLSVVEHHILIEDHVRIHTQAFIPEHTILRQGCWIGPNVVMTNAKYPCSPNVKNELKGPTIGQNAIVGANVTILPGVCVAEDSLIAAGSLVAHHTTQNGVYQGSPAKIVKQKKDIHHYV